MMKQVSFPFIGVFYVCLCAGLLSKTTVFAQTLPKVAFGEIKRYADFPSKFVAPRHIDVWTPENYNPQKKYAVLYMHDGQMLFDGETTWNGQEWGLDETVNKLISLNKIQECIIVGIWNTGKTRHIEYFPQKPFERLPQTFRDSIMHNLKRDENTPLFAGKVQSDNYLKFLVEELKPFIDSTYATLSNPTHTYIMGSSMGGLISMYAFCEYPNIFGKAACLSTHWIGVFSADNNPIPAAFEAYLNEKLPQPQENRKIYFDYGTETLDALYEPFQKNIDSLMKSKGYKRNKTWLTKKFKGADHSEQAWRDRLHIPLIFLMGK